MTRNEPTNPAAAGAKTALGGDPVQLDQVWRDGFRASTGRPPFPPDSPFYDTARLARERDAALAEVERLQAQLAAVRELHSKAHDVCGFAYPCQTAVTASA